MSEELDNLTARQAEIITEFGKESDIPIGHIYWKNKTHLVHLSQEYHAEVQAIANGKSLKKARTPLRYVPPFILPHQPDPIPMPVEDASKPTELGDFEFIK